MSLKSENIKVEPKVKQESNFQNVKKEPNQIFTEPDQEYEPEVGETGSAGTYIPANPDQNDEYEPEVTTGSSTYTPALNLLAKNYVNLYTENTENAETNVAKIESDSDSGSEFEFVPLPEEVKVKNTLTEEEKQNCNSGAFAKHDLTPSALPKVPDVSGIVVPPSLKLEELGKIDKVIEDPMLLLIIESRIGSPPLNDESLVFRSDRKPVGLIFETFGPVKQPFYSIRFNSREDLEKLKVTPGESLYFSPDFSELVKIEKLLKQKGCDASWEDDKECPEKFLEFSDDEEEKRARQERKEKKRKLNEPDSENGPLKEPKKKKQLASESTLYINGLPSDFKESNIKELFKMFGAKKVHLLRYPDTGDSKCSGFVTCASKEKAEEAIERLNMRITLPGALAPLAVKFSEGKSAKKSVDLDKPAQADEYRVTYASNKSTIITGERYKLKDRRASQQHTLHTLMPEPDEKIGVGHAFMKKFENSSIIDKNNAENAIGVAKNSLNDADVFSWGEVTVGSVSTSNKGRAFYGGRAIPPELANPEAHPSPFEDQSKKVAVKSLTTNLVDVGSGFRKPEVGSGGSLVAATYDSASDDDSDPENPSCLAFCGQSDAKKVVPQPRKNSQGRFDILIVFTF